MLICVEQNTEENVMAHDFNDMDTFLDTIRCKYKMKTSTAHEDTPMEEQEEWHSYIADKNGNSKALSILVSWQIL